MNTTPLSRNLKIGTATVGLLGLDLALTAALNRGLPEKEAVDFLFGEVAGKNYIPDHATQVYRDALRREYRKLTGEAHNPEHGLTVRILGPGCVSCNKLNTMVFDILQKLNLAADIEQIHDLDEIWRHGVLTTPALIVNGEVKSQGRHPSMSEVEQWLSDAADKAAASLG